MRPRGRCPSCESWVPTDEGRLAPELAETGYPPPLVCCAHLRVTRRDSKGWGIEWSGFTCTGSGSLPTELRWGKTPREVRDPVDDTGREAA